MYAVDSFRQLSIHFLKFKELVVFEFQRRFLKPLETVMHQCDANSPNSAAGKSSNFGRFKSSVANTLSGQYAVKFFDVFGDDHVTAPITISVNGDVGGLTQCTMVTNALKALPNGAVPDIECSGSAINTNEGFEYTLTFTGNPGKLKQLEVDEYLDGSRSTILTSSGTYNADVYTKVNGEFVDHFPTKCDGITVKVLADSGNFSGDATDIETFYTCSRPGNQKWNT